GFKPGFEILPDCLAFVDRGHPLFQIPQRLGEALGDLGPCLRIEALMLAIRQRNARLPPPIYAFADQPLVIPPSPRHYRPPNPSDRSPSPETRGSKRSPPCDCDRS